MFLTFAPLVALNLASFVVAVVFMLTINVRLTLVALSTMPFVYVVGVRMRNQMFPLSWIVQSRVGRRRDHRRRERQRRAGREVVRGRGPRRSTSWPSAAQRLQWASVQDCAHAGSLRAAHGEPAAPRPGRRAALRRLPRDRRRQVTVGDDRRLQRLRRHAAGAVPDARHDHDAGPAGRGVGQRASTRSSTSARHRRPPRRRRPGRAPRRGRASTT